MTLHVKQEARYQGKDWWEWSVWLDGTAAELKAIDHVEYTLHATFPDPVRTVKTRRNGFRLDSAGWGEFEIFLEIVRTDGKTLKRKHWLELAYPQGTAKKRADPKSMGNVYISSGAADAQLARKLKEALSARGLTVTSADDVSGGMPIAKGIQQAIEGADAAVFVLSGHPSVWTNYEINCATERHLSRIIPVLVGTSAEAPSSLKSLQALHLTSDKELNTVTSQILQATQAGKNETA
jgi:hypothetical protein